MLSSDLNSYFSTFNIELLLIGLSLFSTFEIAGSVIANTFKAPEFTRLFWWVIGAMTFSNIWFVLSPVIGFKLQYLLLLNIFLFLFGLYFYRKQRLIKSLLESIASSATQIIFILPITIPLLVKLSLPPYFADEISYHYFSPVEISHPEITERIKNFYYYLPQSLDNLYRISFSITQSYVLARILHLMIITSALLVVGAWINRNIGRTPYVMWSIFSWYISSNFVSMSTNGLVDMGTAGAVLVFVLIALGERNQRNLDYLPIMGLIGGVALSFKYSALVPIAAHGLIFCLRNYKYFIKNSFNTVKYLSLSSMLFLLFGGFWFIRNLYLTGRFVYGINPTALFSGWTVPLWPFDLFRFSKEFFVGNYYLVIPLVLGLVILIYQHKNTPRIVWILIAGWLLELTLVAKMGGFVIRYYFHWIYIALIIMLSVLSVHKKQKIIVSGYGLLLVLFLTINAVHVVKFVYGSEFTPDKEWAYAKGEIKIDGWIKQSLGEQYELTKWCGNQKTSEITSLYIADPNIIWVTRNGDFQGFLVSCRSVILDLGYDLKISIPENQSDVYVVSVSDCVNTDQIKNLLYVDKNDPNWVELEQYPYAIKQRTMNNDLACSGIEIIKNLYRINRKDFNNIVNSYSSK